MVLETTKIIEQAMVDLAFAQAELGLKGARSEELSRAVGHIRHAMGRLKSVAPEFETLRRQSRSKAA